MKYSMEAAIEASRLEEQVLQGNYAVDREIGRFKFDPNEFILDAGCGTGVLSRYLIRNFDVRRVDAVDYSDLRLKQAADLSKGSITPGAISFFRQDLGHLDARLHGRYDTVICRYVLEHCSDPIQVLAELRKALKRNGRLIVIDLDGVLMNLYTRNEQLNLYLEEIRKGIQFDLHLGRKLPNYFKEAGFSDIEWDAELLCCKDKRLEEERVNTEKRFVASMPFLLQLFGSYERCEEFKTLYLEEMAKPENTLVFTKYICVGKNI